MDKRLKSIGPLEASHDCCGCCSNGPEEIDAKEADLVFVENAPTDLRYLLDFAKAAREALALAKPFLDEVMTWAPYEVAGWHLNGDLEPLENWINENGGPEAHDATAKALALLESE